jgi:HPt (histidine-containing phosphotransfer) domain-containing protein
MNALSKVLGNNNTINLFHFYETFKENFKDAEDVLEKIEIGSKEFYEYIHKIKGTSANLKMDSLAQTCRQIETQGPSSENIHYFKKALRTVLYEIATYITPAREHTQTFLMSTEELKHELYDIIKDIEIDRFISKDRFERIEHSLKPLINNDEYLQLVHNFKTHNKDSLLVLLQSIHGNIR